MECENNRESLVDMIEDLVQQSCGNDSAAITVYATAMRLLASEGRCRIVSECGRRILVEWMPQSTPAEYDGGTINLPRRTWVYGMPPKAYEMAGCSCGNQDTQWSEFENHLWCEKCQKDFIPEHNGILDGPIPVHLAEMMGIRFDRMIIETGEVERFSNTFTWKKEMCHEEGNAGHTTGEA